MKNAYSDTFVELLVENERIGYRKQPDGLLMWEGSYLSTSKVRFFMGNGYGTSWVYIGRQTGGVLDLKYGG